MRCERSPEPPCEGGSAARSSSARWFCASRMRERSTAIALARLRCCERSSCIATTTPVGKWVMRIADSVLFTCWPPAPLERIVSIFKSASLFEPGEGAASGDLGDDFLVAARRAFAHRKHFDLPALGFGIFQIHAEKVAGEEGRFGAARASAPFEDDVALVGGVLGQ